MTTDLTLVMPVAYSREDAARAAGLSEDEIDRAVRTGQLKAKKRGRRVLIPADALRTFIDDLPDWEPAA